MRNAGFICLWFFVCCGCSLLNRGQIKAGGVSVLGVKDAGAPATLNTATQKGSIRIPANSRIVRREVAAQPAVPATKESPAIPAKPAVVETEVVPSADTEWNESHDAIAANSGTVDTSIRAKQIDAEEKRPLLYAAILAAVAAGFFVYRAYPTPAVCSGGASVVFFLAWRMDLPPWIAGLALAAIVGGVFLYFGHERGLYTPVPTDPKPPTQ